MIRVGVEAAGHYHRPLATPAVWPGWEVVELNPAHVTEQRRVMGRRRVKTDAIDLEAITELLLAGRGVRVQPGVAGVAVSWRRGLAHRHRRVLTRTATKNQLLGQLDRCFPGLTLALPDVLGTKVGRLVADAVRRPAPAGRAGGRPGSSGSPPPGAAGAAAGRRAAGGRGPGRVAHAGRGRRPPGAGRGPGAAGRPGHPDRQAAEAARRAGARRHRSRR